MNNQIWLDSFINGFYKQAAANWPRLSMGNKPQIPGMGAPSNTAINRIAPQAKQPMAPIKPQPVSPFNFSGGNPDIFNPNKTSRQEFTDHFNSIPGGATIPNEPMNGAMPSQIHPLAPAQPANQTIAPAAAYKPDYTPAQTYKNNPGMTDKVQAFWNQAKQLDHAQGY